MTPRILHVGVGPLGRTILGDLISRGAGEIVAAIDTSPSLGGMPLRGIVPAAPAGVKVHNSLESVEAWEGVDAAIVTTSSDLRACAPTLRTILKEGKAIVCTCEELVFPWLRHDALARELHDLARNAGGRLVGTGVNPGFLMDALPTFLTAVCNSVKGVRAWRIQDASSRRLPFQKKIGASLARDEFARAVAAGTLRHVGLGESLHFIAHALGWKIESWNETIEPVITEKELTCGLGEIPPGRACGVEQIARGFARGCEVITLHFRAAIGQADPHDRVVIEGNPPIDTRLAGGVHGDVATSAIVINTLPRILQAHAGLHTMATLPMVRSVGT